ncbi:MAG: response regulator [Deltaproteobacteria bacterium]|nr:response regulator [Deltaproteobacteria bacterium]
MKGASNVRAVDAADLHLGLRKRTEQGIGRIRVLVVDDEHDLAGAIVERLRRRGFQADAAFHGEDAASRIERVAYDVMVVDLKLPGSDGLQLIERARSTCPGLQAVVLTGHMTIGARMQGERLGVVAFLEKPADIEALCRAIRAAADRAEAYASGDGNGT